MKTKLLRKVRKRFEIIHYPNGKDRLDSKPRIDFIDNDNYWNNNYEYINERNTKENILSSFKTRILIIISRQYAKELPQKQNYNFIKLWHI